MQPRSQGVSSLPPFPVGTETLVAAAHVTMYSSKTAGYSSTFGREDDKIPHPSSSFFYHRDSGWSRDQPQPRSLFQRQREAEKRDPGNEIEQNTEYLCKCYRADVLQGWCAARTSLWNSGYDVIMVTDSLPDLCLPKAKNALSPLCCHGNITVDISWNFEMIVQQLFIVSVQCWKILERYSTFCDFKSLCVHIVTSQTL